ncbi:HD domain-containing protein 2 [Tetrabaena socialis]|uniref:HD domain-containing protein 2 n=1 Tax=Tetrabaena socialis TaxID=47790 RepID=A0A2J8A3L9_9CHLO|nr:HD domain-containing protein 2 [Tetrabaena socialis]|eukprot:PNH07103.1 HD domain-containing protein 2 [Tetrabaena socialis]
MEIAPGAVAASSGCSHAAGQPFSDSATHQRKIRPSAASAAAMSYAEDRAICRTARYALRSSPQHTTPASVATQQADLRGAAREEGIVLMPMFLEKRCEALMPATCTLPSDSASSECTLPAEAWLTRSRGPPPPPPPPAAAAAGRPGCGAGSCGSASLQPRMAPSYCSGEGAPLKSSTSRVAPPASRRRMAEATSDWSGQQLRQAARQRAKQALQPGVHLGPTEGGVAGYAKGPKLMTREVESLWLEYEGASSPEALLVKDFDKLEMILTAHQYEEPELLLEEFFTSTAGRFKTATGWLTKRTGWVKRDVAGPESIADHMYRMALMSLIATDSAVDVSRKAWAEELVRRRCASRGAKAAAATDGGRGAAGDAEAAEGAGALDAQVAVAAAADEGAGATGGGDEPGSKRARVEPEGVQEG